MNLKDLKGRFIKQIEMGQSNILFILDASMKKDSIHIEYLQTTFTMNGACVFKSSRNIYTPSFEDYFEINIPQENLMKDFIRILMKFGLRKNYE